MAYRLLVLTLIVLYQSSSIEAGQANLSWTPPTTNADGTPLLDLTSYEIHSGCISTASYERPIEVISAPASSYTVLNLPDGGTCYFAAKATRSDGVSSVFSNEAQKLMGSLLLPGVVNDLLIIWSPLENTKLAVTYLGTASVAVSSVSASTLDLTHTVASGTTLLLLTVGFRGNLAISSVEDWDSGQAFTQISISNPDDGNDVGIAVYGLVSPTVQSNTITVTYDQANSPTWIHAANFGNTNIVSVAAAAPLVEMVENKAGANTIVFASGGTAGNGLFVAGGFIGVDGSPATDNASFIEVVNTETGGGSTANSDHSLYASYLLDGAPTAVTIDWATSENDENAGIFIEIVAAAAGGAGVPVSLLHRNQMKHMLNR